MPRRGNQYIASRVFKDAVAAIERNGSCREYVEHIAEREPKAFLAFLGKVIGKLVPPDEGLELEAEKVFATFEDMEQELRRRGLPVPDVFNIPEQELARQRLTAELQVSQARLKESEKARYEAEEARAAAIKSRNDLMESVLASAPPPKTGAQ
jgi:hypothetical protein